MTTEFDDALHYGIFATGTTLTSATGKFVRQSELVLAALRAQGVFDIMVDSTTAPAIDKLWLDKNSDPAVLKEWDSISSTWQAMTFDRLFGRAIVMDLVNVGGTANAITADEPSPFIDGRLYGLIPLAGNTGATTVQIAGVGTYDVVYPNGDDIIEGELVADLRTPLLFANGRFEIIFGSNAGSVKRAETDASSFGFVIDEDDMASDSAEKVPTQQSVKAFVDGKIIDEDDMASDSATEAPSQQSVKAYVDAKGAGLAEAATRTAMKALSGTSHPAVYLNETGREGVFGWDGSDLSTEVTADPHEGIYVAPTSDTTGASGAWVRQHNGVLWPQWFGAQADGTTDDTTAMQATLDMGLPIEIVGTFLVSDKLTSAGSTTIRGQGKTFSRLLWDAASTDAGIAVTLASWDDLVDIRDLSLWTKADTVGDAIYVDWYALGTTGITYFETKSIIANNDIRGFDKTTQGFENGIYLKYPFCVRITGNTIQGKYTGTELLSTDFASQNGIYIPDQSQRTLAILRIDNNEVLGFLRGIEAYNVEGSWVHDNDVQVCYSGVRFTNTIQRVNQVRILDNHIGVSDVHIQVNQAAHAIITSNEISYRQGRTSGSLSLFNIVDLASGQIIGNTIRGNQVSAGTISLTGISLNSPTSDKTQNVVIDDNNFRQLHYAIVQRVTASNILVGPGNIYDSIYTIIHQNDNTAGGNLPAAMGSGNFEPPSGINPALYISMNSSAGLAVNRESTSGALVTFHSTAGAAAGVISLASTSTVTYGTSSDYRLKSEIQDLKGSGAFIDGLRPRQYRMGGIEQAGFLAHEFADVSPLSVVGEKDAVDEENNPIYQSMQASTSEVMANIIAELQSLRKRVADLETS